MRTMHRSLTDIAAGVTTSAVGVFVLVQSWGYPWGSAREMGPGYFPAATAAAMILLGAGIILVERRTPADERPEFIGLRPLALIMSSIAAFGFIVGPFGLAPATFIAAFLSALADRGTSVLFAVTLSTIVAAVAVLLFTFALGLQIEAVSW
jgi:hypothetical protein